MKVPSSPNIHVQKERHSTTTSSKVADVAIIFDDRLIIQLEVQSSKKQSSRYSTVVKLMYGLIDQLRDYMNKGVHITSIQGFYIPVGFGHVELVNCKLAEDRILYLCYQHKLRKEDILQKVKTVFDA